MNHENDGWENELMNEEDELLEQMREEFKSRLEKRLEKKIRDKEASMPEVGRLKKNGASGAN